MTTLRIGQGFDAHRFATEQAARPLVLGGVRVPHPQGLAAHSDGDVLLHALIDALLGAASLGDIGQWFPDTSAAFERIDSRVLLREVMCRVGDSGYAVVNVDLTVIAQRPKLAPHIPTMRDEIARNLGVNADRVNVKATTTEHMGFTGRGEGIAALAVALLRR